MATKKISIVILQYNDSANTIRCLESVKELTYPPANVRIVDNASEPTHLDNIINWLTGQLSFSVQLIVNPANLGYAGGNNVGIRAALADAADYVLVLNPDTKPAPNLLDQLLTL